MQVYILKRNNQQSGPYTAQQLHGMGLLPTDQVRMAGSDIGWSFVDEIDELAPFVVSSSIVTPQGLVSKKDILREPPISGPDPAHPAAVSPDSPITTPWSKIRVDEGTGEKNKDLRPQMPSDPSRNIPASAPEDKARPDGKFDGGDKNVIDVIVTDDSRIAGKIMCQQLKAKSFTFGEINLKLADTAAKRLPTASA